MTVYETTITLSDGDTLVRIRTSQHHVIQHLRKDKRFTETTDPSRCTTEEAEFTIPRTEWTPWGGAKHRRQLTDEQQIREQVAADIWEYWPFRRTARHYSKGKHDMTELNLAPIKDEHRVSCTDELVTKSFGTYPGTVARCTCGWKSSWTTRDGSAEADGARHIRYKKKGQTND